MRKLYERKVILNEDEDAFAEALEMIGAELDQWDIVPFPLQINITGAPNEYEDEAILVTLTTPKEYGGEKGSQ